MKNKKEENWKKETKIRRQHPLNGKMVHWFLWVTAYMVVFLTDRICNGNSDMKKKNSWKTSANMISCKACWWLCTIGLLLQAMFLCCMLSDSGKPLSPPPTSMTKIKEMTTRMADFHWQMLFKFQYSNKPLLWVFCLCFVFKGDKLPAFEQPRMVKTKQEPLGDVPPSRRALFRPHSIVHVGGAETV